MPTCPICNKEMKYINNSHLKSHNLTPTEFKAQYPNIESISEELIAIKKKTALASRTNFLEMAQHQYEGRIAEYNANPKLCVNCNCSIPYEKRKNKFCSSNCSASFNNKNREVNYSEQGILALRETGFKNKINLNVRKGWSKIEKRCAICNGKFLTDCKHKDKKTCSDKCKRKIHALNNHKKDETFGKWGHYKGIYCASSWELAFLVYNLDLGKDIKRCEITFSYIMEEEEKTYFPDFTIEEKIYEVKGREMGDVALKTQAVVDAGYQIELIRKKEITPIIKFLKEKYGVKDLTELYDKK